MFLFNIFKELGEGAYSYLDSVSYRVRIQLLTVDVFCNNKIFRIKTYLE